MYESVLHMDSDVFFACSSLGLRIERGIRQRVVVVGEWMRVTAEGGRASGAVDGGTSREARVRIC